MGGEGIWGLSVSYWWATTCSSHVVPVPTLFTLSEQIWVKKNGQSKPYPILSVISSHLISSHFTSLPESHFPRLTKPNSTIPTHTPLPQTPRSIQPPSPTPFPKLPRPLLKLPEALLTDTGSYIDQTSLEILKLDRADLVHGHVEQGLAQAAERTHGRVFGEGRDVGAGEPCLISGGCSVRFLPDVDVRGEMGGIE